MDASAIHALGDLAIQAQKANRIDAATPAVIIGNNVISLEHLQEGRSRFRGALKTNSLADFVGYVKRDHTIGDGAKPAGFIDATSLTATAFFNLGDHLQAGHADHRAELKLEETAAYKSLKWATGGSNRFAQRELAEWLEEWAPALEVHDENGNAMPTLAAILAVRSVTVKASTEAKTTVGNFAAQRTAMEDIEAKATGGSQLPGRISFAFTPATGLAQQTAQLRLYISVKPEEKPTFVVRWSGREQLVEAIAQDFKRVLFEELGDAAELTLGTFTP